MHRHGYKGRKFGRERDQRRALIQGLAEALIIHESIETTLPKAKELVPYIEKLVTKAKKGDLHNTRQIISKLQTIESAQKLINTIAPRYTDRVSGHVRVTRTSLRRGDNTQMASIEFIKVATAAPKKADQKAAVPKKPATAVKEVKKAAPAKTPEKATKKVAAKSEKKD